MDQNLTLGQKIRIDHKLKRSFFGNVRNWIPNKINKCDAIVVGKRYLANGSVDYTDGGPEFVTDFRFPVWLVVTSMGRKPFYILHPVDEGVFVNTTEE